MASPLRSDPMERVLGIGGVFLKARDPERLRHWYAEALGVSLEDWGGSVFRGGETVWALFENGTSYLGPPEQQAMVNYRVRDLDAMLAQLRAAGAQVDETVADEPNGRFGWATDPEGNRIELWQPNDA